MFLRTLKSTLHAAAKLNQQSIFAKPTVRQLTQLLVQISENNFSTADSTTEKLQDIRAMIQKYDSSWPRQIACCLQPVKKEHIVVTGTTGGLGSHLLARLLQSDKVERIWAMNRRSSKGNWDRQIASFEDKLLDIRSEATAIIHNAWQVNFNLSLQSFEPSVCGVRNLLDLARQSIAPTGCPRFMFASSIAVAGFGSPGRHLNETTVSLEDGAASIGYGQSKLVAEKLLESARRSGLHTCIVRLGQLTGDAASGSWSATDWVPSLVGSSVSIGCLPGAIGTVSWLPLDVAADSIIDVCVARSGTLPPIVHACHPRPVAWMDIMSTLSTAMASRVGSEVPIIRFDDWNRRVMEAAASFKGSESDRFARFPSTKIQATVNGMVWADNELRARGDASNAESGGTVRLDISTAKAISKNLRLAPELGMGYVQMWVEYWESMGLFRFT
ncbi:L-aminoadipate-semialdehyde dehydrogenase [Rhizoctonia solani AG-1 IB]|uniref:L-aminoadipate-semialdehyde dehydrogenase n=1 Tax=Thanatephorus cucumeris (strain AG1-IB / isolate 7/3/14) TaxID=1108050 RepID=M5CB13_THACB|nr:L-aminoadipate-semialdehyde dehydrogenase [Rhizoctonia solani AG-1 IB]